MKDFEAQQGAQHDMRELARARAEQERTADDLTRLIDTANAPIIGIDATGSVNEWNQTAARITGFGKAEVLGRDLVAEFITDDYKSAVKEVLDKALLGEETSNYEFPLFTKSGNRLDVLLNSTTRRDADGAVVGVVGVGQDITELARARAEQERTADDLTRLIDTANAPIIGIDARGSVNEWNQTAARITGFGKAEVLGRDLVAEFITDDYKSAVKEVLDKALLGEETSNYEFPLFTKSGNRLDVLLNSTTRRDADGAVVGVVGVGQDITELARARAEQERTADDLTRLIDTANAPIIGIDATGSVNEWNQTAARITGFGKAEVLGRDLVAEFITDDYKSAVKEVLDKALLGEETSNYEFPLFTKSGNRLDVLLNSTTRRDADGAVVGVVGVGQDITELARARAEQERTADDLTRLIDTANAPIIGIDARGSVNEWNQTAARITGFGKAEVLGRDLVAEFITDDYKSAVKEVLDKALLGEETSNYEFPLFTKSGNQIFLLLNATSRRNRDNAILGVIGIGQDMTARREQEAQLQQRIKLEALGGLTGGIAHDFNNLLTIIIGNLSLLEPTDQDHIEIVEDALKAASDGSELVRSLLAFSRRQRLVPQSYELKTILSEFQRSLARTLGESVDIAISVHETLGSIFVDRAQFETALLNLCINARDAIQRSGHIKIEGRSITISPEEAASFGIDEGQGHDFVMVQILDDGCGIEEDLLTKVTEPFFTTKEAGDGSGLGLSSVAGFVKQSGGGLRITSEVGLGTSVELLLPLAHPIEMNPETVRDGMSSGEQPEGNLHATILVVDDEPRVRQVAARWLAREGYSVLQAQNAESALKQIEESDGEVDVLFSDIVMPGKLDGRGLADVVSEMFPDIAIQLTTGYEHERQHRLSSEESQNFPVISKPYDLQELSSTLRQLVLKKLARV